jgi:branched-subunit amino acid ABC-type transport system permease component
MTDLLQLIIAGLATGAIYALAAIGFTLLWQASQTINFAQGEFVMLPAFFALAAMKWFELPYSLSILIAVTLALLMLGLVFKTIVVDPLIGQGVLPLVISTIALAIFLKEGVKDVYSAEAQSFPTLLPDTMLAAFVAAIVGGFNQVRGAIAGGLVVGVIDNLAAAYVSTAYRQAVPLLLLVLIILFRPQGLLGRKEERTI